VPKRAVLILAASFVGIFATVVGAVYALAIFIESIVLSVSVNPISVRIALSGVFVAAALFLYAIKNSRGQFLYGMLEVAVGLVANWQSLDTWFHPVGGADMANVIYSRFVVFAAGTYAIGRGISNAVEGFERFFPNLWPKVRKELAPGNLLKTYVEGYYKPRLNVPTKYLRFQILSAQDQIAALEKKLEAAVKAKRKVKLIERKLELSREELKVATARYEKEVLGSSPEASQENNKSA
jgi:hypothetical protein